MSSNVQLELIRKKIIHLKIFTFFSYFISVFYMVFILIWFNQNGVTIAEIFAYNLAIIIVTATISNLFSHISDKISNRLVFIQISNFTYAIGVIFITFEVNFISILIYVFLTYSLSRETFLTALNYEIIEKCETLKRAKIKEFEEKKAKEFVKFRIMGSLGWAIGAPIAGLLLELYGFPFVFLLSVIGYFIIAVYWFILTRDFKEIINVKEKKKTPEIIIPSTNKKILHRKTEFIGLLIAISIFEIGSILIVNIKPIYATELGGSLVFVGFLAFIWANFEVPLFFLSSKLTEKYSYIYPLMIGIIFLCIKNFFYLYIITPDTILLFLLLEILNPFGIMWPALTYAINHIFAKEKKALGTSIYFSVVNIARFIGNLLGMFLALLYNIGGDYKDYQILFIFAMIFLVLSLIFIIILKFIQIRKNKFKK